ncbi:MAG: autotransporter assembly complex protein TamA [Janthinobacterium lividum]
MTTDPCLRNAPAARLPIAAGTPAGLPARRCASAAALSCVGALRLGLLRCGLRSGAQRRSRPGLLPGLLFAAMPDLLPGSIFGSLPNSRTGWLPGLRTGSLPGWLKNLLPAFPPAALLAAMLLAISSLSAQAAGEPQYAVELRGAGDFTAFLQNNLSIVERASDSDVSAEELQRRVAVTPHQIRDLLATEGYFSPTVEGALDASGTRPLARFTIALGAPVLVSDVAIDFAGAIADNAQMTRRIAGLRSQWSLSPGQRFRQAAWDDAKAGLLKSLLARDYPGARISRSQALVDAQAGTVRLAVTADSGPAFTFGVLQIEGLDRYGRSRIDALNPITPGMPYSQESLNELQARLQDSGYYRSAFTTIEVDPSHPSLVPVRVDLNENERKKLSFGVGVSTDAGLNGRVKWLNRQFLGRDWRLESDLKVDRSTKAIGSDLYFPTVRDGLLADVFDGAFSGWQPSVGAHFERTNLLSEINDKLNTSARLTSADKNNTHSWALQFFADRQQIPDLAPNNRRALVGAYSYTRRRLDVPLSPTRGYVGAIELAAGPKGPVNVQNLARVVLRGTWLHPFDRRWSTVLRAQAGQVFGAARENVPDDLLFRTGGDQTVRGFAYDSLGVAQNGAVVGGRVMAILSAELVYHFTPQWGAALFSDAGNAADAWRDFRLAQGSGVGARWRSPIGPVNVDLAFDHATWQPRLHFSVGYGF